MKDGLIVAGVITATTVVIFGSQERSRSSPGPAEPSAAQKAPEYLNVRTDAPYSNIRRADYVGPEVCGDCHPKNYANWKKHPHSRMNMLATDESVVGDFSGVGLSYGDGRTVFRKQDGAFWMENFRRGELIRRFRITRTIGWRYFQEYIGVQVQGPEPPGDPLYTAEIRLNFGYTLKAKRWLPRSYFDPLKGSEYLEDGHLRHDPFVPDDMPFNTRCVFCHNTYPYDLRLYVYSPFIGFEPPPPLPVVRDLVEDDPRYEKEPLLQELARELGDRFSRKTLESVPVTQLVTVGISCESCHFGGREHAYDNREIRFVPTHPLLEGWTPEHKDARKNPAIINAICMQCHHSGDLMWPDGSARLNSLEAVELAAGGCRSQLTCTACHQIHVRGPDGGAPDRPEHLAACMGCHSDFQSQTAAADHSRHDPGEASCLDCHMPRIVYGFDVYNRSHRISSPTDPRIVPNGMPNACNLCHLDESLAWTRDALEAGWGKRVSLPPVSSATPTRSPPMLIAPQSAGEEWLEHPFADIRLVAAAAYARSDLGKTQLTRILRFLDEPTPFVRMRSLQIVERILGRKLSEDEYTLTDPPERRGRQVQGLLKQYSGR